MSTVSQEEFEALVRAWEKMDDVSIKIAIHGAYMDDSVGTMGEQFKRAMLKYGAVPFADTTVLNDEEYKDILAGDTIWASIRKNSGK